MLILLPIVVAAMRPDMVLYSEWEYIVYFIEFTISFKDAIEKAFKRKKLKYAELVAEARQWGWQAHTRTVEIGVQCFVAKSTTTDFAFWFEDGHSKSSKGVVWGCWKSKPVIVTEAITDYLGL